jgi:Tfp pilus assembly protein PilF
MGIVLLAFAITCRFPFLDWDDMDLVAGNPLLKLDRASLGRIWSSATFGLYTPLAYTLWAAVSDTFDRAAWAFHGLNVLLQAGCAGMAFLLLNRRLGSRWPALLGALFFGLHPLAVEPVSWISGMNNLLAGALSLAALYFAPDANERGAAARWRYAAATAFLLLALLSKPTAIAVPLMALVLNLGWRRGALWLAMAGAFVVVGARAQPAEDVAPIPWARKPIVALDAVGFYSVKVVFPAGLSVDYGRRPEIVAGLGLRDPYVYVGMGVVLLGLLLRGEGRRGVWLFVIPLLPTMGFRAFDFQSVSTVADRYAYLALLGPAYLAAVAARHSPAWRGPIIAAVPAAGLITLFSLAPWRETVPLFSHALLVNPQSYVAPRVLGHVAALQGRADDAERLYRQSIDRYDDPATHLYLGNLLNAQRRYDDARAEFDAALVSPVPRVRATALNNRGILWWRVELDVNKAGTDFRAAIDADPTFPLPYVNLALVTESLQPDEARRLFLKALDLDPTSDRARRGLDRLDNGETYPR